MVRIADISSTCLVCSWNYCIRIWRNIFWSADKNTMVSRNLWISYFSFAGTNLVVQQVFFFIQKTKAGQWKIFIFGDFSNDFNAYVFFSLDFIGICSYMVTSNIITGMMQISENWPGKSSALHFNDFWFPETFFVILWLSIISGIATTNFSIAWA